MRFVTRVLAVLAAITVMTMATVAIAPPAGAVDFLGDACQVAGADSAACNSRDGDRYQIIGANGVIARAANMIALVAGVAAVILIFIGAFQFITAAGDSGKITAARKTVMFAIVGLVVIALARTVIVFVVSKL